MIRQRFKQFIAGVKELFADDPVPLLPPTSEEEPPGILLGDITDPETGEHYALCADPEELHAHALISGLTRKGKSRELCGILLQKIDRGEQVIMLDPHGNAFDLILSYLVQEKAFHTDSFKEKVLFYDLPRAAERDLYPGFDILNRGLRMETTAQGVLGAFHRVWPELDRAPAFDSIVLNGSAILNHYNLPLTLLYRLLQEESSPKKSWRDRLLQNFPNPSVMDFFNVYYKAIRDKASEAGSTYRRINQLFFPPELRYGLSSSGALNLADFGKILAEGKSVFINLNFPSDESMHLWGALLLIAIEQAALRRLQLPEKERQPCTIAVDEFPLFVSKDEHALNTFLQRTAGAGISMYLCHQNLSNVPLAMRGALDNCALRMAYAIGKEDAEYHVPHFMHYDPLRVKDVIHRTGEPTYIFYTLQEQRAIQAEELTNMRQREAYVALPRGGGYKITSPNIPDPEPDESELQQIKEYYLATLFRSRDDIKREEAQRLAEVDALLGLQEEAPKAQGSTQKNVAPSVKQDVTPPAPVVPQPVEQKKASDTIDAYATPPTPTPTQPENSADEDDVPFFTTRKGRQ